MFLRGIAEISFAKEDYPAAIDCVAKSAADQPQPRRPVLLHSRVAAEARGREGAGRGLRRSDQRGTQYVGSLLHPRRSHYSASFS